MQLFCRLYDGISEWELTSACTNTAGKTEDKKERREVLSGNSLALGGFTQPEPFLQLFKPLARTKDGFYRSHTNVFDKAPLATGGGSGGMVR